MNREIAMKWVADLRNPDHKQTIGKLFDGEGYCCLGRLCVVMGETFFPDGRNYVVAGTIESKVLPERIARAAGLRTPRGWAREGVLTAFQSLDEANDHGATFAEIADWIEANYEKL